MNVVNLETLHPQGLPENLARKLMGPTEYSKFVSWMRGKTCGETHDEQICYYWTDINDWITVRATM